MDDPDAIAEEVVPYLSHWNISPAEFKLASHSENIVFKVVAESGDAYAFRVHRPGYHTKQRLDSEQMWTQALLDCGLLVPKAYATNEGGYYVSAKCGGGTRQLGLIGWLEGQPLDQLIKPFGEAEFPIDRIREAGEICAKFHDQATTWQPPREFTRQHLNVDGLLGEAPFWGRFWEAPGMTPAERITIEKHRERIRERLVEYDQPSHTYSMIHADMHEENLFVSPHGLMVIDFDDSGFGWHQYDLAIILISHLERPDYEVIRQTLLNGYLSQRPMSDEDLELVDLFLLMRTLALIGWVTDRPELGRDDYAPFLIDQACSMEI